MLGEVYFDTYRRYKAGTDKVLKWLTDTAGHILGSSSGTRTGKKTNSPFVNDYPLLAVKSQRLYRRLRFLHIS